VSVPIDDYCFSFYVLVQESTRLATIRAELADDRASFLNLEQQVQDRRRQLNEWKRFMNAEDWEKEDLNQIADELQIELRRMNLELRESQLERLEAQMQGDRLKLSLGVEQQP
jgi:hypothetical protein